MVFLIYKTNTNKRPGVGKVRNLIKDQGKIKGFKRKLETVTDRKKK